MPVMKSVGVFVQKLTNDDNDNDSLPIYRNLGNRI